MILVDTSVWINHLRHGDSSLVNMLHTSQVLTHPFVIGELSLGNIQHRKPILDALGNLPQTNSANNEEVLAFIEENKLYGLGIGYIDAHLLASVRLTPGSLLWTQDKGLFNAAKQLNLHIELPATTCN